MSTATATTSSERRRIESDLLGPVVIAGDVLYGPRTARALGLTQFTRNPLSGFPEYLKALFAVKMAAAEANLAAGALSPLEAAAIIAVCQDLIRSYPAESFPVDLMHGGGGIAVNTNVNEVIATLANRRLAPGTEIDPKLHVNASQSTADVCHSAARIALVRQTRQLNEHLQAIRDVFTVLAERFAPVMTVSRTCMRDASPVSMGSLFSGYAAVIERRQAALGRVADELCAVNLGGTVIGSGEGACEKYRETVLDCLRRATGMELVARKNFFDAAQNSDDFVDLLAQLALLADALIKIAKDLRLLSSGPAAGFGELILAPVMEGSSFYPGKINPVMEESVIQAAAAMLGEHHAASAVLAQAELNLNIFEGFIVLSAFKSIAYAESILPKWSELSLTQLQADEGRCQVLLAAVHASKRTPEGLRT